LLIRPEVWEGTGRPGNANKGEIILIFAFFIHRKIEKKKKKNAIGRKEGWADLRKEGGGSFESRTCPRIAGEGDKGFEIETEHQSKKKGDPCQGLSRTLENRSDLEKREGGCQEKNWGKRGRKGVQSRQGRFSGGKGELKGEKM